MSRDVDFFIFRHGETDWNAQKRFQGHTDIPLNETGRAQALALRERLRGLGIQALWSSDLSRALETCRLAAEPLGLPIRIHQGLREARLGEPEGQELDHIRIHYGEESWNRWRSTDPGDHHFAYPGGETKSEHLSRVRQSLVDVVTEAPHLRIIGVSTHGGSLIRLIHSCEECPSDRVMIANASLHHIVYKPSENRWIYKGEIT